LRGNVTIKYNFSNRGSRGNNGHIFYFPRNPC